MLFPLLRLPFWDLGARARPCEILRAAAGPRRVCDSGVSILSPGYESCVCGVLCRQDVERMRHVVVEYWRADNNRAESSDMRRDASRWVSQLVNTQIDELIEARSARE